MTAANRPLPEGLMDEVRDTKRGFPRPVGKINEDAELRERFIVLRLTDYERMMLRPGSGLRGKVVLVDNRDGTHELVRVDALLAHPEQA